jgi:hypothetical protein
MSADLQLLPINGQLLYTFDWTPDVPGGATLTAVDYVLPAGSKLTQFADSDDLPNRRGTIGLRNNTARKGDTYEIEARGTLSNGEQVPKYMTLRIG